MTDTRKKPAMRALCALLAVILLLGLCLPVRARAYTEQEYYQNAVLFWVNTERQRHGLSELKTTDGLNRAADVRAGEIVSSFGHTRPDGRASYTVLSDMGIDYGAVGENIAAGYFSPCDVVSTWMNSSGHRANILDTDFSYVGVGYDYVDGSKYKAYWTQLFSGGRTYSGAKGTFSVAPTAIELYFTDTNGKRISADSVKSLQPGSYELIAAPEPSYATAAVTCTSSDSSVVKVAGVEVNRVTFTCLKEGTAALRVKCGSVTNDLKVTVISPEHQHSYSAKVTKPTCTEQGFTTYTCTVCGESYVGDYTAKAAHSYGGWTQLKAPTCTEYGQERSYCKNCTAYQTRNISPTGHSYKVTVTKATCTEQGFTTRTCSVCGYSYDSAYTAALGHSWDEGVLIKEPTVSTAGIRVCTCTRCGVTGELTVPVLSHPHEYISAVKAPTCAEQGFTTYTCSICGETYTENYVPALGHVTETLGAVSATCTEAGYTGDTFCTRCGETVGYGSVIPAPGHKTEFHDYIAATCTEAGLSGDKICVVCGVTVEYARVIPALGHVPELRGAIAATCTEKGYTGDAFCTVCGERMEQGSFTEPLGHDYKFGKCTRCGAVDANYKVVPIVWLSDIGNIIPAFQESIMWAVANGITTGYPDNTFRPDATCTRGHVVTFLWRAANSPEPESPVNPFRDVSETSPYYKAILWAAENGITTGYSDGTFRPNAACTRAHVVTFLWRYENKPAASGIVRLNDIAGLNADFSAAIRWAASRGITTGYSDGSFRPNAVCTRAHVVTFLFRDVV